ncbi:MAG: bifunctional riboflavin kinase/FAD synthetase [Polyangiaceae bacterium]
MPPQHIDDDALLHPPNVDPRGAVVAIGNFDGVHVGHQMVLRDVVARAEKLGLSSYVLTFDPHPSAVLGRVAPSLLTTLERRSLLVRRLGVTDVLVRHFDRAFAAWSPERFAEELLAKTLRAKVVVVGDNFGFGAKRAGNAALLQKMGAQLGFEAFAHPPAHDAKGSFSSSRARAAIAAGDLADAEIVLSRWHSLSGVVVEGAKLGRTLGFPTANLGSIPEMLPADGIYAVVVDDLRQGEAGTALAKGVMSIGVRPTIGGDLARTVEVFLFDFSGDLYGARLRVHVVSRLREERKYDGLDALKVQIGLDAELAKTRLEGVRPAVRPGDKSSGGSFG